MKISACIITKNQDKIIENCLQSIVNIVDEIIVLDTGSTDNTISICSKYGQVYQDNWQNDFSKSRNKSMSYATGDWILFIDSDEVISPETQERFENFKINLSKANDYDVFCFSNYNPNGSHFINTYFKSTVFKNNVGITFIKKIHEHPYHQSKKLNIIQCKDMEIHHFGEVSKEKAQRDIIILLESIEEDSNQKYYYYRHLADSFYILKYYDKSLEYYLKSYKMLDSNKNRSKMQEMFYINTISRILRLIVYIKKDYKRGIYFSEYLLKISRDNLEASYYLAFCSNRISNYQKSIKIYNKIIKIYNLKKVDPFIINTYIDLSRALIKLFSGDKIKGYEVLTKAFKISPENNFIKALITKYYLSKNDYRSAIKTYYNLEIEKCDKFNTFSKILDELLSYELDDVEIQEIKYFLKKLNMKSNNGL